MKFCVSCRHGNSVLKNVQEIKVEYKDTAFIEEYIEQEEKPHTIVLRLPKEATKEWAIYKMYNDKLNDNFMIALDDLSEASLAQEYGIKFYWNYPVTNYYELEYLVAAGASQIIVGMPLIFDIDVLKTKGIKLRLIPNYAFNEYLVNDEGVCAGWIRPEDLVLYEDIAESCEFFADSLQRERVMLQIYQSAEWPDDLSLIIVGINKEFHSQHLAEGFGIRRLNCKQVCKRKPDLCHFCERVRTTTINLKKIKEHKEKSDIDL